MLNMLKAKFELVTDLDLHLSFEKGMRGEVSYASKRYSKFSHKYLKSYDPKQESKHIIKYGYVMSAFLLTSWFKWIDSNVFDLNKYTSNSSNGCVLEFYLQHPNELCLFINSR